MYITIRLIYKGIHHKILSSGTFPVIERKFKEDPHEEAARVAMKWIRELKRESEVNDILKVEYNDSHDITKLINEQKERESN